jgi:8-oxo-dGTP diphosphatase
MSEMFKISEAGRKNPIRNSAKAIIIADGKLLCTKNQDDLGSFYLLPGGGQEPGETLVEALQRECLEEIGAEPDVSDLRFIREYIGKNHEFAVADAHAHQVEFYFTCRLAAPAILENGAKPDSWQIGVEWLNVAELDEYRIYPQVLIQVLRENESEFPVYLGDVN